MIEQYYKLDVDQFYRDYQGNIRLLKQLEAEKEQAVHTGGMDYSETRVDGGMPGDPTVSRVFQRLSVDKRIARVQEYFDMERKIYSMLNEEEKGIADALKAGYGVSHIESKLFLSESQVRVKVARFKSRVRELAAWV
jgi:hypothetical protein